MPVDRRRVIRALLCAVVVVASATTLTRADATVTVVPSVQPGTFAGQAFDACTAPSSAAMKAWRSASPYGGIGIYVGGSNRGCAQPNLTAAWVDEQRRAGWHLIPLYVGPQASCTGATKKKYLITNAQAGTQGAAAAQDAATQARSLGLAPQSVLIYDMEAYRTDDAACRQGVLAFISAWTARLHDLGYLSGFYSSNRLGRRGPGRHLRGARIRATRLHRLRPLGPDFDRPRPGYPRRLLGAAPPDEAVPGRSRRDLGRRLDQHRPEHRRLRRAAGRQAGRLHPQRLVRPAGPQRRRALPLHRQRHRAQRSGPAQAGDRLRRDERGRPPRPQPGRVHRRRRPAGQRRPLVLPRYQHRAEHPAQAGHRVPGDARAHRDRRPEPRRLSGPGRGADQQQQPVSVSGRERRQARRPETDLGRRLADDERGDRDR